MEIDEHTETKTDQNFPAGKRNLSVFSRQLVNQDDTSHKSRHYCYNTRAYTDRFQKTNPKRNRFSSHRDVLISFSVRSHTHSIQRGVQFHTGKKAYLIFFYEISFVSRRHPHTHRKKTHRTKQTKNVILFQITVNRNAAARLQKNFIISYF